MLIRILNCLFRLVIATVLSLGAVFALANLTHNAHARETKSGGLTDTQIKSALKAAYDNYRLLKEGKNADYIPALAAVPSKYFGISLVTTDGKVYSIGDSDKLFSIQSISKVFTLAEVLQESGEKTVMDNIGVNATGNVFNSFVAVEKFKGKNLNSFVNPGAIATTSMVKGATADEKWARILGIESAFAGRQLAVNQEVYKYERDTSQRNQAIGMLMYAYGRIQENPQEATDIYTRQCSINVNAKDLAVMAATLANGGYNPLTGRQIIDQNHVRGVLSEMATAGLYDDAGAWLFKTGLPAKSGVGGGMLAVVPGRFGIAAFSPPLDEAGNSVRAQRAITDITAALSVNPYDVKPEVRHQLAGTAKQE